MSSENGTQTETNRLPFDAEPAAFEILRLTRRVYELQRQIEKGVALHRQAVAELERLEADLAAKKGG